MEALPAPEAAPARPFTVQVGYPTWYAITLVVEARSIVEACERAVEEANGRDGWRSIDDCGPTFVERLAEGDDVDLWAQATSALPVPHAYSEHGEADRLHEALAGLLDWAATMGGWDAEAWRVAERAVRRRAAP
ncbi:MAG: hypothetical protein JOY99_03765 [Sphingomonadaceae bacterium]|nr:hypothetical protein [Sphingomonadaceae bacterium]